VNDKDAKEGSTPAGPISQFHATSIGERLNLLIGGYRTNQASVLERRHELIGLAPGWGAEKRLSTLVGIGKDAKKALRGKLYFAVQGTKDKGLKGLGAAVHETAEKLFYVRTESLIHETFSSDTTFREWGKTRRSYAQQVADHCRDIFEELTNPYTLKPELIPVIAWSRRALNIDLKKLTEETA